MKANNNLFKANDQIIGKNVKNYKDEDLGKILEIMIDKLNGKISYVVLESGSFLGMGGKLFALPWNAIKHDIANDYFLLDIDKEKIKKADGFDKDNWPDMSSPLFADTLSKYYEIEVI